MRTRNATARAEAPRLHWIGGLIAVLALAGAGGIALAATSAAPTSAAPMSVAAAASTAKTAKKAAVLEAAEATGSEWLKLIDAAQWVPAWNATGSYLRATVAEVKWLTSIARVRLLTGALVDRTLKSAYETTYLPGAPYGHYVVVYYVSRFVHRRSASETLTLMEDSAGHWRVVGYYLN